LYAVFFLCTPNAPYTKPILHTNEFAFAFQINVRPTSVLFFFLHFLLHLYLTNNNCCLNKFAIQMEKTKKRGRVKRYPCVTQKDCGAGLNNLLTVAPKSRNQNKVKIIPVFLILFFFFPSLVLKSLVEEVWYFKYLN